MSMLGLKDTLDELARASGVQWYDHILRRALNFEVTGRRGRERLNMTWKRQVEEHINQIGLKREDAIDRVKWRNGVYELSKSTRRIRPPALTRTKQDLKNWISLCITTLTARNCFREAQIHV